jgi:hypothetical protein
VLASISGLFPVFLTEGDLLSDSWLPEGVRRAQDTTYAFVAIGITLANGMISYIAGGKTRRELVADPENQVAGD